MQALFLKLVNMSITASWLVLAVVAFRFLLKKAPKYIRVILWGLVGLRLVFPFSIESVLSLIPSAEPLPDEFLYTATPQVNTGIQYLNNTINPVIAESLTPVGMTSANPTQIWSFIFSHIWLIGLMLMAAYALISYLIVRKKVAPSIPMGKNLRLCDSIDTPFILGIVRPKIYLPSSLDQTTATHVLAHENAHLKRHDHWWKPLGFLILTVYWFNPVMWLAYILLCRDIEMACDEKVIKELGSEEKKAYSTALLQCSVPRRMIAACPLAFGEVGVKDRIKSVLNYKKPTFWIIVVAVITSVVVAVCFLTDPVNSNNEIKANYTIGNILDENGYRIINRTPVDIHISIPKSALHETIYSSEGQTFAASDVVVYETETTLFYLDSVRFANEGDDKLYFKFNCEYTPTDSGVLTLLYSSLRGDNGRYTLWVEDKFLYDDYNAFADAVSMRGVDGITGSDGGSSFTVYVDTEICKRAEGSLNFTVNNFTELTYEKSDNTNNFEDFNSNQTDRLAEGDYITTELVYWPLYSSYHWEEDPTYQYMVTEDHFYSEYEKATFEVDWQWRTVAECAKELGFYFEWYKGMSDLGMAGIPATNGTNLYQKIDTTHHLFLIDDVLYLVEGYDTGTYLTNVSAIYKLEPDDDTDVPVTYPESTKDSETHNLYSTISNQIYDSRDGMNMLIRNAVIEHNMFYGGVSGVYFESHQILGEIVGCGKESTDGSPVGFSVVEVTAIVMKAIREDTGVIPGFTEQHQIVAARLTIDRYADGTLKLSDYREKAVEDQRDYDPTPLKQRCYDQAVRYWGLNTDLMVDSLLDTVSSSPAQYSNAQPYIEAHQADYDRLVYLGEYTLNYCFNAFLNNQSGGIRAEIMAAACREIGEAMGENIDFDGQYLNSTTWFDAFHANALELYEANGLEALAETNRVSWVLLNIVGQTPEPIQ